MSENPSTTKIRRDRIKKWFNEEIKSKASCLICGESDALFLDYHHLKDKKYRISRMINKPYAKQTILDELKKCVAVCTKCHRAIHDGRINVSDYMGNKRVDGALITKEYVENLEAEAKLALIKAIKSKEGEVENCNAFSKLDEEDDEDEEEEETDEEPEEVEVPDVEVIKVPYLLRVNDSIIDPSRIFEPTQEDSSEEELPEKEESDLISPLNKEDKLNEIHLHYGDAKISLSSKDSINYLTKKAVETLNEVDNNFTKKNRKEIV